MAPWLQNGSILLVTEEDYEDPDCSTAGSAQTSHIKRWDGSIVPLTKVELAHLATYPLPVGAFCSAHCFDYHQSGIVSVGYYGGATQFIDVTRLRPPATASPGLVPPRSGTATGSRSSTREGWQRARRPCGSATDLRLSAAAPVGVLGGLGALLVAVRRRRIAAPD